MSQKPLTHLSIPLPRGEGRGANLKIEIRLAQLKYERTLIGAYETMIRDLLKMLYLKMRKTLLLPFLILRKTQNPSRRDVKRILFLRHDRIGDMVLSTALLKALRRTFPGAMITVLASEGNYEILKDNPNVDEVLIYRGFIRFVREIPTRGYDLTIDPFITYELKQAFMAYVSGARYRIGFESAGREVFFNLRGPATSPPKGMIEHLMDLVEAVGGSRDGCEPEIFLSKEEIEEARTRMEDVGIRSGDIKIAFHPGGHYPSQRWPVDRFGEVAKRVRDSTGAKIYLFLANGEEGLLQGFKVGLGGEAIAFTGIGLREFISLLSQCHLLVCNNSGPLHIASALKIPTVSIMGPTVTPLWLPWGENHIVIRKDIECSPCNKAICKDHKCMESITVEEVAEAVRSQIDKHKNLLQSNP